MNNYSEFSALCFILHSKKNDYTKTNTLKGKLYTTELRTLVAYSFNYFQISRTRSAITVQTRGVAAVSL